MITLEFNRSPRLVAAAIRAATWSEWDHVGLVLASGKMLSAMPAGGVMVRKARESGVAWQRFQIDAPSTVLRWAQTQIGKSYDWSAVIGLGLHRDWAEEDRWFCSELVAWAFQTASRPLLRGERLNRITPGQLATSPLLIPISSSDGGSSSSRRDRDPSIQPA